METFTKNWTVNYKYCIPGKFFTKVAPMEEFANGGMQVTVLTTDGKQHTQVLISNATYIIAMRGNADLPFKTSDIKDIYQTEEDKNPQIRGGWNFWDDWS